MLKWIAAALVISVTISGCSDDKKEEVLKEKDNTIVLSADGIGSINSTSSFNMHQVTLAFTDFNVIEELNYHTGAPYPVIKVSDGVKPMLTIIPDESQQNIFSVIVEDNKVENSLGHHLGMLYKNIYKKSQADKCQAGAEDMLGKALCYAPKTPNILYVFNGKANGTPEGTVPSNDVLESWVLESIIWRPKSK
jgi:hypothetical protein